MARTIESLQERIEQLKADRIAAKLAYAEMGRRIAKCEQEIARIKKKPVVEDA